MSMEQIVDSRTSAVQATAPQDFSKSYRAFYYALSSVKLTDGLSDKPESVQRVKKVFAAGRVGRQDSRICVKLL